VKTALIAHHGKRAAVKIERAGGIKGVPAAPAKAKSDGGPIPIFTTSPRPSGKAPSVSSSSDNVDTSKKQDFRSGKTVDDVAKAMWG